MNGQFFIPPCDIVSLVPTESKLVFRTELRSLLRNAVHSRGRDVSPAGRLSAIIANGQAPLANRSSMACSIVARSWALVALKPSRRLTMVTTSSRPAP